MDKCVTAFDSHCTLETSLKMTNPAALIVTMVTAKISKVCSLVLVVEGFSRYTFGGTATYLWVSSRVCLYDTMET